MGRSSGLACGGVVGPAEKVLVPSFHPSGGRHAGPFRGGSHVSSGRGANSIDARCVETPLVEWRVRKRTPRRRGQPARVQPIARQANGERTSSAGMARGSWSVWQKSAGGFGCPWGSSPRTPQRRLVRPCTRPRDHSGASKAHGSSRSRGGVFTHVSRPDRGKAIWIASVWARHGARLQAVLASVDMPRAGSDRSA